GLLGLGLLVPDLCGTLEVKARLLELRGLRRLELLLDPRRGDPAEVGNGCRRGGRSQTAEAERGAESEGDAPAHDRGTVLREKTLSRAPPATRRRAEGAERAEEQVQPEPAREERTQGGHGEDDEA